MKKLIYLTALIALVAIYSCGGGSQKETDSKTELKAETIQDCDDFLAHYEEWVDEYLKVLDDYFKNPADPEISSKYMELMQEAMEWPTKWLALVDCANDEEYEKKFDAISKKIEEKMKEMGL